MTDRADDRSRRPAWLALLGAAVLVPTVFAGLIQLWPRPQIEDQLTRSSGEALAAAGFPGAGLVLAGRDAVISGIDPADAARAVEVVQGVPGIRVATVADAGAPADAGPAAVPPPAPAAPFGIARRGEDVVLSGVVGTDDEKARLLQAATTRASGRTVVDNLAVTAGAPLAAGVSPASIEAATAALAVGVGPDATISIADSEIRLTGTVADETARNTTEQAVAAALPGLRMDDQLVIDPALTSPAAPAPAAGSAPAPAGLDPAARQRLQASVTELLAGAPITFQPNSPALTEPGRAAVGRLLILLQGASGARLQIDGFVATGPGSGQYTAQQLSDQRAATVRDALVAGGVPAADLVARGLGEGTQPAAQAAGRRVDITVI